jgi:SAM-dependent methyltransferase
MTIHAQHLERVMAVVTLSRDIVEQRVDDAQVPAWCETRGWTSFLLSLDAATLRRCEAHGLSSVLPSLSDAPPDLSALAREVNAVTELPMLVGTTLLETEALRSVRLRKRAQLAGLLSAVSGMADTAERIVDVGSGSGHFTRLSAELFGRAAVGLELNPARVASARAENGAGGRATFVAVDAREGLNFDERDLAIGLHACGELGDRLVEAAARARCDLALVSCCLQKISTPVRRALSTAAARVELRKANLGLTNLTAQPFGIEASIDDTIQTRETRYALGLLLRKRGVALEPGAEMRGINRRQAAAGLEVVAKRALALRELPPTSRAEITRLEALARERYAVVRRLSLPRSMLSRLLELLVSLDRAVHLEERGLDVCVATLFERAVSPRNIGIFASLRGERLPAQQRDFTPSRAPL